MPIEIPRETTAGVSPVEHRTDVEERKADTLLEKKIKKGRVAVLHRRSWSQAPGRRAKRVNIGLNSKLKDRQYLNSDRR